MDGWRAVDSIGKSLERGDDKAILYVRRVGILYVMNYAICLRISFGPASKSILQSP